MTKKIRSPSEEMIDTSFNDDWIKKPEDVHPILCIPNPDGVMLVIGGNQAQKEMTPKQQAQLGLELIRVALKRLDDVSADISEAHNL